MQRQFPRVYDYTDLGGTIEAKGSYLAPGHSHQVGAA